MFNSRVPFLLICPVTFRIALGRGGRGKLAALSNAGLTSKVAFLFAVTRALCIRFATFDGSFLRALEGFVQLLIDPPMSCANEGQLLICRIVHTLAPSTKQNTKLSKMDFESRRNCKEAREMIATTKDKALRILLMGDRGSQQEKKHTPTSTIHKEDCTSAPISAFYASRSTNARDI